jgi:hypothetical protein
MTSSSFVRSSLLRFLVFVDFTLAYGATVIPADATVLAAKERQTPMIKLAARMSCSSDALSEVSEGADRT